MSFNGLIIWVLLLAIWFILTRTSAPWMVLSGVLCTAAITILQQRLFPPTPSLRWRILLQPIKWIHYFVILLIRFIYSTLYTTKLIITGRVEGAVITLPITLTDKLGLFLLFSAITITPSTIAIAVDDDLLYVHWIRETGSKGDWQQIKESIEDRLVSIFIEREGVRDR
ncbi:Na+/H+ antiporter subunit E [Candidatus Acetothermia bacterium]|jgi:multisubunit Na+/H+ antiporter MnhE subunit|nr:Na+/H+ antiporter subunit E [Candidatus Acetothermia bacterium]MCI2427630.1 Na+/H+ antiporter subunit E [Candidatus Acetothermia bacterium]MCI2428479.1 Na+/H+ antiporter subunit E [Candidatus Acetothermia bacterium]